MICKIGFSYIEEEDDDDDDAYTIQHT